MQEISDGVSITETLTFQVLLLQCFFLLTRLLTDFNTMWELL